jgi:peptide/nickel transport system substrate-binding protein
MVIGSVALLVLAGCTGSESVPSSGTKSTLRSINERDPATLMDCGDLRLPITQFPMHLNPLWAGTPADYAGLVKAASYPRAFTIAPDGSPALDADYFTAAEETATNPQVVTYTINPRAQWTDGSPITWEDIASQVHALSGTDPRFQGLSTAGYDRVLSVTKGVDDRQAVMTFREPFSEWREMLSGFNVLLPQSITSNPDHFVNAQTTVPGPSAGPFLVSTVDQQNQQIILRRNPKWWGRRPRLERVTLVAVDPHGASAALHDSKIDALELATAIQVSAAERIPGIDIRRAPTTRVWSVFYNGSGSSVMSDPALRRAITRGIDRKTILEVTQRGLTDGPTPSNNHLFANGQDGYQDNSGEYGYDPDQAGRDLDALGWKLGDDGRRYKDGRQLILHDYYVDSAADDLLAQLLQNSLTGIGVTLEINDVTAEDAQTYHPAYDLIEDIRNAGPFPLTVMQSTVSGGAIWNVLNAEDPTLAKQIAQTVAEPGDKALEQANDVDKALWAEAYSVPLLRVPGITAVRSDLANFGAFGRSDIDFTAVGFIPDNPDATSC